MKSTFYVSRLIICLSLFLLTTYTAAEITIDGETIHVETDNYKVQFDRGTLTQLHNKLTGETYTRPLDPRFRIQAAILRTHESFWARYGTNREIRTINPNHAEILFTKGGNQLRMTIALLNPTPTISSSAETAYPIRPESSESSGALKTWTSTI